MLQLTRVGDGPILRPRPEIPWEKDAVLNASAVYADGTFHLHYRAVAHRPENPNRSSIGYATSPDGVHFERRDAPVLSPGAVPEESQGVEDPRVTKLDDTYVMLYTAYDLTQTQIAMATSTDLIHWDRHGIVLGSDRFGDNKDAVLFPARIGGRYCMMHRPDPDIYLAFSGDLHHWTDHVRIMAPAFPWERRKIGGGTVPIATEAGWLVVYHGVDEDLCYRLGVALLDLDDPTRVLARQPAPILEPAMDWELTGDVNTVVFTCGAVLLGRELWVYYGAADTVIGLAKGNVDDFLADL